ncbi:MAG TPA: alpha-1,4-glucan--maltose-1-phosphate maltosyltransferase [Acidimicrobiales bacterium]|nr:alpha-1,4-glucan--maltose-1-phosphate maltosyltransferase [Acidimicrobiales bacterium]
MLGRITIDSIRPVTPSRAFPTKAIVGERVTVSADVFRDGHDLLGARVRWRRVGQNGKGRWHTTPMEDRGNDRWQAVISPTRVGRHEIVVEAWRDRFATWRHDIEIKAAAGDDVEIELEEGAHILEALAGGVGASDRRRVLDAAAGLRRASCSVHVRLNAGLDDQVAHLVASVTDADLTEGPTVPLWVDRPLALFGAWYELFPRSEGGFDGAAKRLRAVADMGFDIVYLPPIHPIGVTERKGPNNTLGAGPDDPGSPWAIGSDEGGHTAIAPELGTIDDFRRFCGEARDLGLEVALDYALQCSPDHPWVHEHPEWFWRRPDGSIRYAENPPKKYQDIYPINFWPEREADREALWAACRDVLRYWIDEGIRIFRVDNPHTKPMAFWAWLIERIRRDHPDVILLSEAFTRPKVMAKLAEVGFTQSYTYFTWRNEPWELRDYVNELAYGPTADYMRPNFWPNTPDIVSGPLRHGPPAAFRIRLVLAALLVPSYGIYSGYELYENEPASDTNEEYLHSEKYEIRRRDWGRADSLAPFIATINDIRRRHAALHWLRNVRFHGSVNDRFLVWSRGHRDEGDLLLVVVNLDPHSAQETVLRLDLGAVGLPWQGPYTATDELTGDVYTWDGPNPYVRLDPRQGNVAHVLTLG